MTEEQALQHRFQKACRCDDESLRRDFFIEEINGAVVVKEVIPC
ncbi:hypothetical protein HMPREF0908_0289 [Selenomonas flueggei ATCC 43531]|uniref:Uncharacterized protein n=1 Tax=Selenomonas flueggei ATCC 43531 TaxID=638302 RepID=C4V195_9FIRM|nr:hypothetical protein HMPREF0908_0289 [Selenomonas flueggei ATCC 43531]